MRSKLKFNLGEVANLRGMVEQERQRLLKFYSEAQLLLRNCTFFFQTFAQVGLWRPNGISFNPNWVDVLPNSPTCAAIAPTQDDSSGVC
jgi:hypothetical protein